MKRVIRAASIAQEEATAKAKVINKFAKQLLDAMENTPSGFLDANDLGDLYEVLIDTIPALDFAINSNTVEYQQGADGRITRQ